MSAATTLTIKQARQVEEVTYRNMTYRELLSFARSEQVKGNTTPLEDALIRVLDASRR